MSKKEEDKPTPEGNKDLSDVKGEISSNLSKELQKLVNQNSPFNNLGIVRQFDVFRSLHKDLKTIGINSNIHWMTQWVKTLDTINISNQRLIDSYKDIFDSHASLSSINSALGPFAKIDLKNTSINHINWDYNNILRELSSNLSEIENIQKQFSKSFGLKPNKNLINASSALRDIEYLYGTYNDNFKELSVDELESVARNAIDSTKDVIKHDNEIEGQGSKFILENLNINYAYQLIMLILTVIMIYQSHSSSEKLENKLDDLSRDLKQVAESAKNLSVEMNVNIDQTIEHNTLIAKRESTVREKPSSKSDSVGIIRKDQALGLIQGEKWWYNIFYVDYETGDYEIGWVYKGNLKKGL
ncbi:hypothetical protein ACKGJO_03360 [Gracilimonas sp. Q87]|uniref:hypothetical protein n=1 Tax=Gracilimonas sp. Q87 TaxID=3384766 RepID=UPI0039845006